jgi:hypothetical protein
MIAARLVGARHRSAVDTGQTRADAMRNSRDSEGMKQQGHESVQHRPKKRRRSSKNNDRRLVLVLLLLLLRRRPAARQCQSYRRRVGS